MLGRRKKKSKDVIARAVVAGIATGLRSQVVFPVLARAAARGDFAKHAKPPIGWLRTPWAERLTTLGASGELVADKLPTTPARIEPQPLIGRLAFGAMAGALLTWDARRSWVEGAVAGAAGALVGSFAGYWARKRIVEMSGLPDPVVAVAEDATAVGLARRVVPDRQHRRRTYGVIGRRESGRDVSASSPWRWVEPRLPV
jgi:uncharacterized membrane protein